MSMKEFIRFLPLVLDEGRIIIGSKKTTLFLVDAYIGELIAVHDSSTDATNTSPNIIEKGTTMKQEKKQPDKQLSFTRTDYTLTSFAADSDKVLWNVTVADIDVALLCHEKPNSNHHCESCSSLDMPLPCRSKAVVHRLRSPDGLESFKKHDMSEPIVSVMLLPEIEVMDSILKEIRNESISTQLEIGETPLETLLFSSSTKPQDQLDVRKPNYIVNVLIERRIEILVSLIAIGFLMYRQTLMAAMLKSNAKSSCSKRKRNRKSKKNFNDVGKSKVDSKPSSVLNLNWKSISKLVVSNKEIALGSNGIAVLEGIYEGRNVAVKRIVRAHHDVADKEYKNLIASDHHSNIVRFYGVEYDHKFVYLSLERCACSLYKLIQKLRCANAQAVNAMTGGESFFDQMHDVHLWRSKGYPSPTLLTLMRGIISGLIHLHSLGIIHRDLKPSNVLIVKGNILCAKLSAVGISRRLVGGLSTWEKNARGWQAPEQLLQRRQTCAVDLFSLGCVLFYCITGGRHPFGDNLLERDGNIVNNRVVNLHLVEDIPEALNLIYQLLNPDAELRPKTSVVLCHPLFWNSKMRNEFLRDTSDRLEREGPEYKSVILQALEGKASAFFGKKWDEKLEPAMITHIELHRHYDYKKVRDLPRVIRNQLSRYRELPTEIQDMLGSVPEGIDKYYATRFPKLLMEVYNVMYIYCVEEEWFDKTDL